MRLLVALALILILAPAATAQPAPQPIADQTADWLTGVLGVEVPRQNVGTFSEGQGEGWAAASYPMAYSERRYILARPWVHREWTAPSVPSLLAGHLLIHELLHGLSLDDGAVDAVALDLLPAWVSRFAPRLSRIDSPSRYALSIESALYRVEVRNVRALSMIKTGKSPRSRDAILWRRAWLVGDQ